MYKEKREGKKRDSFREEKRNEKGSCFPLKIFYWFPFTKEQKTQADKWYCTYLLPVKNEPFSHVIPILIFLEKFTAWKRRAELQHHSSWPSVLRHPGVLEDQGGHQLTQAGTGLGGRAPPMPLRLPVTGPSY